MKRIFVFLLGMLAGAILFASVSYLIVYHPWDKSDSGFFDSYVPGLTIFEEAGEVMPYKSFEVLQTHYNGNALVHASKRVNETDYTWCDIVYMFKPETGGYYDGQVLKIPGNKVPRIIGTYYYKTEAGHSKTVPVITFYDN